MLLTKTDASIMGLMKVSWSSVCSVISQKNVHAPSVIPAGSELQFSIGAIEDFKTPVEKSNNGSKGHC